MKILLYTQEFSPGGSLRLLLNLAKHLQKEHTVYLSFNRDNGGGILLKYFDDITIVSYSDAPDIASECDVLLAHLPYGFEALMEMSVPRKLVVSMEIISRHPAVLNDDHIGMLDGMLYLHSEQVAHLSDAIRTVKCFAVPIINNIVRTPAYNKSGTIGCVGSIIKHDVRTIIDILRHTPENRQIKVWCHENLKINNKFRTMLQRIYLNHYRRQGRIRNMGIDADLVAVLRQYDLLLHTPADSIVVSDALASGKMVLLSPLPVLKKAFGAMEGVYFLDDKKLNVESLLSDYDENQYQRIHQRYAETCNRTEALRRWQRVIEGKDQ
jgi:hypothetical protein